MPETVEELFREHGARIYNLLLRLVGGREDASDLTQEVFLKAGRGWSRFEGRSSPSTWLIRIAINTARDHLRRRRRERQRGGNPEWSLSPEQIPLSGDRPDRDAEAEEARRLVAEALGDLDPPAREIILLREAEEMPYQDLADMLGVPLGTVQSRLARAREALREAVRRRHPDWKP